MITSIVNFKLPAAIDGRKATDVFKSSAPKYRAMKGLVRKYYLFDDQNRIGGGVYLWQSRADADAVYTPQWKAHIAGRYGAPPDIRYFETPVVVDNETDKILADAAQRRLLDDLDPPVLAAARSVLVRRAGGCRPARRRP